MVFVQHLDAVGFGDIGRGHDPRTLGIKAEALRPLDFHAQRHTLEVQDDVGHVFAHTGDGGKLVQYVVDLHRCDRRALQRGHQHAAQRVAEGQAKAPLQRFGHDGRLTCGVVARLDVKLLRLDQFSPILVDHASLHPCLCLMSK